MSTTRISVVGVHVLEENQLAALEAAPNLRVARLLDRLATHVRVVGARHHEPARNRVPSLVGSELAGVPFHKLAGPWPPYTCHRGRLGRCGRDIIHNDVAIEQGNTGL